MTVSYEKSGHAALHLARAASLAPSPHNSQPWFFVEEGHDHGFEVHADGGRRLILTDPGGREMVIACGAALFNTRMAVRHLGFQPSVDLLPRPGDSAFLARVGFAAHAPAGAEEAALIDAMPHRHTHRGPFASLVLPSGLLDDLREHARIEGAVLHVLEEPEELDLIAHLVRTAEAVHRADPGHSWEVTRSVGPDQVPADAARFHPDATLLAGRDYLDLARRFIVPARRRGLGTGTVAVLSTPRDGRLDWLRAGQALQRVLLSAASRHVMAAFHTQPLELPEIRAELRRRLAAGNFPQMVLRLGVPAQVWTTARRPASEVLVRDDALVRW
ncbi:Acg family FMN-binding oxidoreductase [Streptomyces sp. NPDC057403]|uniref:Acg family FMN-binding oxidoreductase n=1 Tax=Streptomyces sp. NPDC057403 TaxID=3346119 RepID=UPI0036B4B03C